LTNGLAKRKVFTMPNGKTIETPIFLFGALKSLEKYIKPYAEIDKVLISSYPILCNGTKVKKIDNEWTTKKFIDHDDNAFIFLDSGGYSFTNKHISITPQNLIDLYKVLKPDIGAILDLPFSSKLSLEANCQQRWKITLANTEYMYKNRENINLCTVLHGGSFEQVKRNVIELKRMFKRLKIDNGFDNIALGSVTEFSFYSTFANSIVKMLLYLRKEFPDAFLHMFGVNSFIKLLNCYYLGVDSIDSATWRIASVYGDIYLPNSIKRHKASLKRYTFTEKEKELLKKCNCPICKDSNVDDVLKRFDMGGTNDGTARALHNYWIVLKFKSFIDKLIKEEMLESYIDKLLFKTQKNNMYKYTKKLMDIKKLSDYY
jgi:tRNA-guanine family transglycosylase